jgi:hypothetical protein
MPIPTADDIRAKAAATAYGKPLVENSYRGLIAEIITGEALGQEWRHCSGDWRSWDFEHRIANCKLEVKQSAARQTWDAPPKPSPPRFDIEERTVSWEGAVRTASPAGRFAQVYVFAHHPIRDETADHLDPAQWRFYVVPASRLLPKKASCSRRSRD